MCSRLTADLEQSSGVDVLACEDVIRAGMASIGADMLERFLGADRGYRGPVLVCPAGHSARFVGYRGKHVHTALGPIRLHRAYYHCVGCRAGFVPRDVDLALVGRFATPGLRKMIAVTAAAVPFAAADRLIGVLAGLQIGAKRIERVAEADGRDTAQHLHRLADPAITHLPATTNGQVDQEIMYIAIDGTGVPMVAAATRDRTGKHPDRRARTREAKLAAIFTQTCCDADGYPIRDPESTTYTATFDPAADFGPLVAAEARRRGSNHTRQLVVLGDGAPWIWNLATRHWPEATPIVDIYHAREHLHDLATIITTGLPDTHGWLDARLTDLDNGDIESLVHHTEDLLDQLPADTAAAAKAALPYFTTNAHRMRYDYFRSHGFFIGSGVIEAGCKSLAGARLKLSGMHWNIPGATGILTLRAEHASNRLDTIWTHHHNQTPTTPISA